MDTPPTSALCLYQTILSTATAHRNEGESAAIAELNLPARVRLVESSELHVGAGHDVGIAEGVL